MGNAESNFEEAVKRGIARQFAPCFQPIASIVTGRIESLEAGLVRWSHPRESPLTPALFLRAIERSQLGWMSARHVLELAAAQAREWITADHMSQWR